MIKIALSVSAILITWQQSAHAEEGNKTPINKQSDIFIDGNGPLSMDFMNGRWIGNKNGLKLEEVWTPMTDGRWFGTRKTNNRDNVEFEILSFTYRTRNLSAWVRRFEENLDEPINKTSRFCIYFTKPNTPNTANIVFPDGTSISYRKVSDKTVQVSIKSKDIAETVDLIKQ